METNGPPPRSTTSQDRIRRLASQFVRPHRLSMTVALVGMFAQSLLLLPVPMLQGWVLDRVMPATPGSQAAARAPAGAATAMIVLSLAAMVACHAAARSSAGSSPRGCPA